MRILMALRAHHYGVSFMIAAIVLGSLAFLTADTRVAQAACASGSSVVITYPSTASNGLSGIVTLKAQSVPFGATGLSYTLLPANIALGQATLAGSEWTLNWDTRNHPNGSYQVMAVARYGNLTTQDCASAAVPAYISNTPTQAPKLSAALSPASAQMNTGASVAFVVDTIYADQYGRVSHVSPATINWVPKGGTVASYSGTSVVIRAGTVAGAGILGVDVTYAGLPAHTDAALKIVSPTTTVSPTPTPPPNPTPSPIAPVPATSITPTPTALLSTPAPLSSTEAARLSAMPTIFRPASPTNSNPIVSLPTLGCMEKNVGAVRFAEISGGQSQPTATERKAAANCFSGIEALPTVLAPIAPASVVDLPSTTIIVTLAQIKKQTITGTDGAKINAIHLSGTGAPNSSIYLYVFSDPLVLRAETNNSGDWEYVLETKLPSGNHEIYAVAEKDSNNFVRTSAVPIAIAAAAPGSQDGALVIENKWSQAQLAYAGGAALMVVLAIFAFFAVLRRRGRASRLARATALISPSAPAVIVPTNTQVPKFTNSQIQSIVDTPLPQSNLPGGEVDPNYPHDPSS